MTRSARSSLYRIHSRLNFLPESTEPRFSIRRTTVFLEWIPPVIRAVFGSDHGTRLLAATNFETEPRREP